MGQAPRPPKIIMRGIAPSGNASFHNIGWLPSSRAYLSANPTLSFGCVLTPNHFPEALKGTGGSIPAPEVPDHARYFRDQEKNRARKTSPLFIGKEGGFRFQETGMRKDQQRRMEVKGIRGNRREKTGRLSQKFFSRKIKKESRWGVAPVKFFLSMNRLPMSWASYFFPNVRKSASMMSL